MTIFFISTLFCLYSWLGFIAMMDYHRACLATKTEPFGNSNFKYIFVSLLGGGITTVILILATIGIFKDWLKTKI